MKRQPPLWADRFLVWFCRPDLLEDLQGDLYELFEEKADAQPQSCPMALLLVGATLTEI